MAGVPPHLSTRTGDVVWYCSGSLDAVEAHLHADTSDGLVLRGDHGLRLAHGLRKGGWTGRLWLDPATYERRSKESDLTLFGDRWTVAQDEIAVVERISPGTYVPSGDRPALRQAIEDELRWLSAAGDGRLSLALDSGWLSDDTDFVIAQLSALDVPIAIALADGNDPLSRAGAVSGYVEIVPTRACSFTAPLAPLEEWSRRWASTRD